MAASTVGGVVVTIILEQVIRYAQSAMICRRVCRQLQAELESIRPDVLKIELQMVEQRRLCREPLHLVENWLARLKEKLQEAEREVHRCDSGSIASRLHLVENHDLSKKILALLKDIDKLAGNAVSRATLSSSISNGSSHNGCCSSPDASHHGSSHNGPFLLGSPHLSGSSHHTGALHHSGSSHLSLSSSPHSGSSHHGYGGSPSVDGGFETQGSLIHQKRRDEIDSILRAEDKTRQSMNRRHSIASFDFSNPADQPVVHVQPGQPAVHSVQPGAYQQAQHQPNVHNVQTAEPHYAPPSWLHSTSHGHHFYLG